jgi:hypothetical protein
MSNEEAQFTPYCEWGVVKKVWLTPRTVYLIHGPDFYETAIRIEAWLRAHGFNVYRLNTGSMEEFEFATWLLNTVCSSDEQ